ncbi:hypothetical protein [Vibrio neptunius]|uniref:hypothetical protein n=1 Tax=Vibrio neptunius TaxID=170651 RepID=UPI001F08F49B|nr:hypothetical protein [Vibrio neptunius]
MKRTLCHNLEQYEGKVPHMYLDTRGNVTVGVGYLIANTHQAKELQLIHSSSGKIATKSEIIKEFTQIRRLPYGRKYGAGFYQKHTGLILSDQAMISMMEQHIENFENELWAIYGKTNFEQLPDNVKLALFDMIFNLGMPKLQNTFVKFNQHIQSGNFRKAAQECRRRGISDKRNQYVRSLLENT